MPNDEDPPDSPRLGRITTLAVEVLGDAERATRWLQRPNRALGGAIPLALLDTDLGAQQVEHLLGRIEHGVFS
jgi:putative toxin-antitoxin system antitoxin component (TIGR02293 family)